MADVAAPEREFSISASDGTPLRAWLAAPARPAAALLLCHSLTSDGRQKGLFPRLRDQALRKGLAVARFDFRAHGGSGGNQADLRLAGLRDDATAMLGLIAEKLGPDLAVIPLGVSFGGGAAAHAAATARHCAGLVLWESVLDYEGNYGPKSSVPLTRQMRAACGAVTMPEWAAFPVVGTSYHLPTGLLDEARADPTMGTLRRLTAPILIYHGTGDQQVAIQPASRLAAERSNVTLRALPRVKHGFRGARRWVIWRTVRWAAAATRTLTERR